jgi:N-dimethylarginine dimethylaminohydrolase
MCPPTFFGVEYEINPWMHRGNWTQSDCNIAHMQWANLLSLMQTFCHVNLVTPRPNLPDMVFVANAGYFRGDDFILSNFANAERHGEREFFRDALNDIGIRGFGSWEETCEGAGDVIHDPFREVEWWGHGFRTSGDLARMMTAHHNLELVDPRFYHLDTCFCPLTDGEVMYWPGAFSEASLERIENAVKKKHRILLNEEEAKMFSANAIVLGNTIIMSVTTVRLRSILKSLGYDVIEVNLSAFHMAGGSAACLVLKLP